MTTFPKDVRYFERYKLSRPVPQTPAEHARWPEGSGQSGEDPSDPLPSIGSSCEGERLSRKRSSSTSSAELRGQLVDSVKRKYAKADRGVIDFDAGSHAAQLKRQSNAQASKRSRTRLKTMKEELDESKKRERQERELRLQERELRLKADEQARQADEQARQERKLRLQAEEQLRQSRQ